MISRRVLWSTFSNLLGHAVTLGTWFVLTPFILRELGSTIFGLWALVGFVVGYATLLDFGISGAVIKYIAEYYRRGESELLNGLVATAAALYALLGTVAVAFSIIAAPLFPRFIQIPPDQESTATWLFMLVGIKIGLSIPCTIATAIIRGLQRFDIVNLLSSGGTLLSAAAMVGALMLGGGVLGMVAADILVMLLMQLPTIWFVRYLAPDLRLSWRRARRGLVRTVVSFSVPLFFSDAAGRVKTRTDEIVIGAFLPVRAVAPYAIARSLSEVPLMLTNQFMKVLLPLASELHADKDLARLRTLYVTSTRLTLAIFLPIGTLLVLLANPVLTAWIGPSYAEYSTIVIILTVASCLDTSQWPAGSTLQGMARFAPVAAMSVAGALANLALSLALVQPLGLVGVAIGTLIPTAVECLGFVLPYTMRALNVSADTLLKEIVVPVLLPLAPMLVVLYGAFQILVPSSFPNIIALSGAGMLIYVACYLIVGASAVERQGFHVLASDTVRLLALYLKR